MSFLGAQICLSIAVLTLMRANRFRRPLAVVGPEDRDFFLHMPGNGNVRSECHLGPKKSKFLGHTPSNVPNNGFAPIKIKRHMKKQRRGGGLSLPQPIHPFVLNNLEINIDLKSASTLRDYLSDTF